MFSYHIHLKFSVISTIFFADLPAWPFSYVLCFASAESQIMIMVRSIWFYHELPRALQDCLAVLMRHCQQESLAQLMVDTVMKLFNRKRIREQAIISIPKSS